MQDTAGSVIGFLRGLTKTETLNIEEGREDRTCADTRQPGSAQWSLPLLRRAPVSVKSGLGGGGQQKGKVSSCGS